MARTPKLPAPPNPRVTFEDMCTIIGAQIGGFCIIEDVEKVRAAVVHLACSDTFWRGVRMGVPMGLRMSKELWDRVTGTAPNVIQGGKSKSSKPSKQPSSKTGRKGNLEVVR